MTAVPAAVPQASLDTPQAARDIAAARRALDIEAEALAALSRGLGADFAGALDLLWRVSADASRAARVVVTGMGKSGHVGRKIAATFASTGTPAIFVHPAEASHGDLGMVHPRDAVLALSNSGETAELDAIVGYVKRYRIPLVGITAGAGSTLAQAADVALLLPPSPEACPMGLAPTTSTTMMLALGDALAVALLERKGFTARDFQVLHPGGKLGRRLLRVADLMHGGEAVPLCRPDTPMAEALLVMTSKTFGCVGVVGEDGRLIGIITDGDLRRHLAPDLLSRPAAAVMTRNPRTTRPETLADAAMGEMQACKVHQLLVVEDGRPVGVIRVHDLLKAGIT